MAKRYFNWKLAIVLIIGISVLVVTAFGLRQWQRANRADQGFILGNKAYDEHRWADAAENYGRYLAINQNDVTVLMKYAEAQLKIRPSRPDNITQALNTYRIVLRTDKNNFKAALLLTELYLMSRMPGEAELIASKYLENNSDADPKLPRMLAQAYVWQRKFTEAAEQLKTVIAEHPDQILAYETLGYLTEDRPDDFPDLPRGEYWFNEAVNNNPSSALAYISRAGFYRRSKDNAKTLADLEQAVKMDLSDPNDQLRLAEEFMNANLLDRAERHLMAVRTAAPENLQLWSKWAELAIKSNSKEKMLEIAQTGLKELSSQPWDFIPIATRLFILSGELDRAAEYISQMNLKDINPQEVTFLEGLLAFEKGRMFEAINYWKESIGLGNTSPEIRLLLSSALSRIGDTKSALRHLRTLVSETPDYVAGHIALAKLSAQTGNWSESARHAEVANRLSPGNVESALLYHQAQMQLKATGLGDENTRILQSIKEQLSGLEKTEKNLFQITLLQFQLALRQGNFPDASALVNRMKKEFPSQIKTLIAEVDLLVAQDKKDEAISRLFKALEEFPQAVDPVRYLALLLGRKNDREKCESVMTEALERLEQAVDRRNLGLILAEFYIQWDRKDDAYRLLNTLARELPEDIPVKRGLLRCEQVIRDSEKAQKIVNDIKSLEGEEGWQWRYEQAKIWFSSDDYEAHNTQIVSLLQENLQANPNDQESRVLLAETYNRSGELQLAISTYREALNRSPNDLRILIPAIDLLSRVMEFDEVDQLLNRVSAKNLYHPQLQQFQVQSHLRHGQLNSASDVLRDLIKLDPNNPANRVSLALIQINQGNFDEAEKLLDQLKVQEPNSLTVADARLRLYFSQNKTQEALRVCDEIVKNLNNASAYIFRARTFMSLKQTNKAIADLKRAAEIEPDNIMVWIKRSILHKFAGLNNEAVEDIQKALSLDYGNILVQKQAISLFLDSGDTDKVLQAKTILNEAIRTNPNDIDLLLFKVNLLLTDNTAPAIAEAERILVEITEKKPEISRAWKLLGDISLVQGQTERAMEMVFRGLSQTPNDKALLLLKARVESLRSPVLAIPTLKAMLETDSDNIEAALLLAETYIKNGEQDKAVNLLREQLDSRRGASEERIIRINLATALHKNSSDPEAKNEFDSLIQSEKDSFILIDIATKLMEFNDNRSKQAAENILRKVLKNEPDSVKAMTTLAILLFTRDRPDESIPLYERILRLQPDNQVVINNLAWLMCEDKGKYNEALELAQRGIKLYPNYTDLIDTRGVIYYKMGEFDKAIEDFTKCLKLYLPGTTAAVASRFRLAKTYTKLGQNIEAVQQLKQVLDLERQIGGLSNSELTEAQQLLEQLQEGI